MRWARVAAKYNWSKDLHKQLDIIAESQRSFFSFHDDISSICLFPRLFLGSLDIVLISVRGLDGMPRVEYRIFDLPDKPRPIVINLDFSEVWRVCVEGGG